MCGICGIANIEAQNAVEEKLLIQMREQLVHRGPDDCGIYLRGNIGLGFRRLSIVDLTFGHQPMANEDNTVWIVFNGEIYNHLELRPYLKAKGHIYKTRCDTESIIHLYEEEGVDGFQKLNGIFALAIWDERKKELLLVRDRLGVKPLYYTVTKDRLLFASEIKSILQDSAVEKNLTVEGIEEYLVFRYLAGEKTLFKNIFSLIPGQILIWQNKGKISFKKFWDIPKREKVELPSEEKILENLEGLLKSAVKLQLMSDVPLGSFCSGGVDSSLVTALASSQSEMGFNTFSVGFYEPEFDESYYSNLASSLYKTKHFEVKVSNYEFADMLPRLIWFNDEPLNHANSVQIYFLSKLAKEHVTVILTGEGSDELFCGYPRYCIAKFHQKTQMLPRFFWNIHTLLQTDLSFRRFKKLMSDLNLSVQDMLIFNSAFFPYIRAKEILMDSSGTRNFSYRYSILEEKKEEKDLLFLLSYLELKTYLVSILVRQDKMSMAASLEARVPFLDHRLVEFASLLPSQLKLKRLTTKYILKKLAERFLPKEIIHREKFGFGVPISDWLKDSKGLGRYLTLFSEERFKQRGIFNVAQIEKLVDEHLKGKKDNGDILWEMINLELWQRIFFEKEGF